MRASSVTVNAACPHDCPDNCAMKVHVADGKVVRVTGHPDHPMTRGGLCVKVNHYEERVYSPDRVLYPMKRVGPKGSGRFERISWREALDTIATRWKTLIGTHGPQSILPYCYMGNAGLVSGPWSGDPFFNHLGASINERTFCDSGSITAYVMTVGPTAAFDPESFEHSKYIIIWASNTISTNLHLWPIIAQAQKNGAKVVVIDPMRTRTAKEADWHIAIKPGTDAALALAMINVIITEGLHDKDYVERYTTGFDELAQRAALYKPDGVEAITGIPAADIRNLAREFATSQPAAIRIGVAIERHTGGGQAVRAITCLPGLVGAFRHVGGGILQMPVWAFPVKWGNVMRPDWLKPGTRVINQWQLGRALLRETPETQAPNPPVMSLFVHNSNPVVTAPEQAKTIEGLLREDLFTVVHEQFLTDTARYADIVLPATTVVENTEVIVPWGTMYAVYNHAAIAPLGEAVATSEVFRRLARAMGFTDPFFSRTDEQIVKDSFDWTAPNFTGVTIERMQAEGFVRLNLPSKDQYAPHRQGAFPTPSGKLEFKATTATRGNFVSPIFRSGSKEFQDGSAIDPLPTYTPPVETAADAPNAGKYPLAMVSPKSHAFLNSGYSNIARQLGHAPTQHILMHPSDAAARKLADGVKVQVLNDRGSFEASVQITDDVLVGMIVAPFGYWASRSGGSTLAAVNSARYADMGRAPTFSDTRVQVRALG
jgi:anaerobic selenocysteine-containing dehydrogenase